MIEYETIEYIQEYVDRCDVILKEKNMSNAKKLAYEILDVFTTELKLTHNHKYRLFNREDNDFISDLDLLKKHLIKLILEIKNKDKERRYNLEIAKLNAINLTNKNELSNTSNNSLSAEITSNIHVTLENMVENINKIPNNKLSPEYKCEIVELIKSLEDSKNSINKKQEKFTNIMRFIADKGFDLFIIIVPYLLKIAQGM